MRHPRPESLACGQAPYPEGLTPGPASNDRSNATGIHQCRVVDARESMTVAHAHTEVEGPPWRQPAPTTPRSDDSQQRAAACRSNPAPGPLQANGLREAAAAPDREWPRPL